MQLVTFESEEDCRFFYPRRALEWQRQVNTFISRALRDRKCKIIRVPLKEAGYREWLAGRQDIGELRRQYANSMQRLV